MIVGVDALVIDESEIASVSRTSTWLLPMIVLAARRSHDLVDPRPIDQIQDQALLVLGTGVLQVEVDRAAAEGGEVELVGDRQAGGGGRLVDRHGGLTAPSKV